MADEIVQLWKWAIGKLMRWVFRRSRLILSLAREVSADQGGLGAQHRVQRPAKSYRFVRWVIFLTDGNRPLLACPSFEWHASAGIASAPGVEINDWS